MNDDDAEVSMAFSTGLSKTEDDVAEAITRGLVARGLRERAVWSKSATNGKIELQIPGIKNGRTIVDFDPDTFVAADTGELTTVAARGIGLRPIDG